MRCSKVLKETTTTTGKGLAGVDGVKPCGSGKQYMFRNTSRAKLKPKASDAVGLTAPGRCGGGGSPCCSHQGRRSLPERSM